MVDRIFLDTTKNSTAVLRPRWSLLVRCSCPLALNLIDLRRSSELQWITVLEKKTEIYLCKCHKECLILGHV